jgi:L-ascorbate metabolism protein UlaG (beta-lactamase superfamily)
MMKYVFLFSMLLICGVSVGQNLSQDAIETQSGMMIIQPIIHGTLALEWNGKTILVDPYGGAEAVKSVSSPDIVLITDIHGDHLNPETLQTLTLDQTKIIVPQAVADKMSSYEVEVIDNGEKTTVGEITVEAIPMYNLPEAADARHTKGRGNGYVLTMGGIKVYISGDTEDIPEMRKLRKIDVAFVCMNLPYTMTVEQAADAVLAFKPKIVYPYHYRGSNGLSDVNRFEALVKEGNPEIEVRLMQWYPEN